MLRLDYYAVDSGDRVLDHAERSVSPHPREGVRSPELALSQATYFSGVMDHHMPRASVQVSKLLRVIQIGESA